jgi:hypothetical protein
MLGKTNQMQTRQIVKAFRAFYTDKDPHGSLLTTATAGKLIARLMREYGVRTTSARKADQRVVRVYRGVKLNEKGLELALRETDVMAKVV